MKELLDKYYAGETTLAQEKLLRESLGFDSLSDSEIFAYYDKIAHAKAPTRKRRRAWFLPAGAAAAVAAVAFGLFTVINAPAQEVVIYGYYNDEPITDSLLARKLANEALALIGYQFYFADSTLKSILH